MGWIVDVQEDMVVATDLTNMDAAEKDIVRLMSVQLVSNCQRLQYYLP